MAVETTMAAVQAHFEYVNWNAAENGLCHVGDTLVWTCLLYTSDAADE